MPIYLIFPLKIQIKQNKIKNFQAKVAYIKTQKIILGEKCYLSKLGPKKGYGVHIIKKSGLHAEIFMGFN